MTHGTQQDPGDEDDFVPPLPAPFVAPDEDSPEGQVAQMTVELRRQRMRVAGLAKGLAYRELDGRTLRSRLEQEAKTGTKGGDEKAAKEHPTYLKYCQDTAGMEHRKAEAEALAETARLLIQARLATMLEGAL